ncbi:zinc-dependent metalloprotease [Mycobacterium tuberculosis]
MSTGEVMGDLLGFSSETTPRKIRSKRDKRGKDGADSGSGANPLAPGIGGRIQHGRPGQIFTRLERCSAASALRWPRANSQDRSTTTWPGRSRRARSGSRAHPAATNSAIADAVHLAATWLLTGQIFGPLAPTGRWLSPTDWVDNTFGYSTAVRSMAQQISTVWASSLPEEAKSMPACCCRSCRADGRHSVWFATGQALGWLWRC